MRSQLGDMDQNDEQPDALDESVRFLTLANLEYGAGTVDPAYGSTQVRVKCDLVPLLSRTKHQN